MLAAVGITMGLIAATVLTGVIVGANGRRRAEPRLRRHLITRERHITQRRLDAVTRATIEEMVRVANNPTRSG